MSRCRHSRAWPTLFSVDNAVGRGFMWCSDCGAVRTIRLDGNTMEWAQPGWLYPRGHEDVLKQIERMDRR